jgi:tyrosine-protein phosphatase YwqE
MMGVLSVDIHSHVMPGVDDGSRGPVETIAMARGLAELGVTRLYLTPHQYKLGNRLTLVDVRRRTNEVARLLAEAEVGLDVRRGAEYFYGEDLLDAIAAGAELITFEHDGAEHLLVELPTHQPVIGVRRVGAALVQRGIRPVLAHPERTQGLEREYERVAGWREAGWGLQLNLLSLAGRHGPSAERLARRLLADDAYEFVGSDIHRPAEIAGVREAHAAYRSLTEGVPQP